MTGLYVNAKKYRYSSHGKRRKRTIPKIILFLVLFFILFNLISLFLVSSWQTSSAAMDPALPPSSRFLTTGLTYGVDIPLFKIRVPGYREPVRGDVVLVRPPFIEEAPWFLQLADSLVRFFTVQKLTVNSSRKKYWENETTVKRVIAVPGDTVKVEGFRVYIRPAGDSDFREESEFISRGIITVPPFPENWDTEHPVSGNLEPILLGESEYFVLSDSRGRGSDSLDWGPVERNEIRRKVFFRYWPDPGFRF